MPGAFVDSVNGWLDDMDIEPDTIAMRYHITTNMHARHQSAAEQKRVGTKLSCKGHAEHTPRTTTMRKLDD